MKVVEKFAGFEVITDDSVLPGKVYFVPKPEPGMNEAEYYEYLLHFLRPSDHAAIFGIDK